MHRHLHPVQAAVIGSFDTGEAPMARYGSKSHEKVGEAMHELKHGQLKSSTGQKVTNPKQAIAIGLSEARSEGGKVPARKSGSGAGRTAAKKPPAKKATAKKATAKKSASRKTAAKKAPAKAPRKSAVKKATTRKPAAKKATAGKTTARKTAAKKTPAKKAGAKRPNARKAAAKTRAN
jgi:hypothetical protein